MLHEGDEGTTREAIPAALNLCLCGASWSGAISLLWWASHAGSPWTLALAAVLFSFVNNTVFSLLHEAVHGLAHPNRAVNEAIGIVSAALYPTGFSLQRVLHLGHHRRNRTAVETFDYYYREDSRLLKTVQWYGIISGVYWIVVVLGWLVYLLFPFVVRMRWIRGASSALVEHSSGPAYAADFDAAPPVRARAELALSIAFQATLFVTLDLNAAGWWACYLAFGLNWSALQYADHAFSPLDVTEGAWDLRVPAWLQAIFLNYHLHLAHHRRPATPWLYLPVHVDPQRERPAFLAHYAKMWRGPRRAPGPPAQMRDG